MTGYWCLGSDTIAISALLLDKVFQPMKPARPGSDREPNLTGNNCIHLFDDSNYGKLRR